MTLDEYSVKLAEAHVSWFLKSIRPLLIDHMVHGFKHGRSFNYDDLINEEEKNTNEL